MTKTKSGLLSFVLVFFVTFAAVWTANLDSTYAATKKIHLKKTTITLTAGRTYQQKLLDKKGKVIKATKVKWKSSKKSVARISTKGKVTAVKPGTAKMTAKYKGKTYKFTVKVKEPPHNKVISIEPETLSLTVGNTDAVVVHTDNGESLTAESNNDNIDFGWGDWIDDTNDAYLWVSGEAAGTSVVTVYDDYDHSVAAKLNITIRNLTPLEKFQEYICEKGDVNSDGDIALKFALSDQIVTLFTNHESSIDFEFINYDSEGEVNTTVLMTMDLPNDTVVTPQVSAANMLATADIAVSRYNDKNTIAWTYFENGQVMDDSEFTNIFDKSMTNQLNIALTTWNIAVRNLTGMQMKDFGFTSF